MLYIIFAIFSNLDLKNGKETQYTAILGYHEKSVACRIRLKTEGKASVFAGIRAVFYRNWCIGGVTGGDLGNIRGEGRKAKNAIL